MKKTSFSIAAIVSSTLLLSATPALALEDGEPAPANAESSSVAALKIGKIGNFGDCTGTLVADQWVLTARHCLESVNNEGTQARIGGKVYDADSWALSPVSDAGLLHLTQKVTDATPAKVSRDIPTPGQTGTLYGWSSSSSMARSGQLPMTKMVVKELLGGGPTEGTPGEAAPDGATPGETVPGEAVPGEAVPGGAMPDAVKPDDSKTESIPAGTESIPADAAMMPMIQSAILDAHSVSGAGMQGGDSGGPFFVDGKLAGLATAGTSNGDPDLPSPSAAITTLAGTADWIDDITSGRDTESVLTAENTPAPPKTIQTSADHMWGYLAIACVGLVVAAAWSRVRNGRQ
ncbi:trypsin-like serine protease [Corynebacterium amycolatum]|uniref:Trypsin-like serine protease n=1 Tax=Corynebacterium amycolatum TaxID=43765 RepID=A0AB37GHN6_CORAY|nr:trypsin-like serine protease [Corynebacterium amycolatum]MCQ9126741.1 trypsin-like serine protease [Corynebacterium amycolatum]MCQ9128766.1 trypsin-like serine protease [Corynebacterium amycolatum]MCQ9142663.1 trypsin-like serine protease [Corynebacterium amycolatum]MCQ9170530.1 trypsin-like serine protease [Corynebacterium amycolatum]MCQ9177303.1 trypsin-like serine protease [Corynebacterium amycolatum]